MVSLISIWYTYLEVALCQKYEPIIGFYVNISKLLAITASLGGKDKLFFYPFFSLNVLCS